MSPNPRLSGFLTEKNWLCWEAVSALFNKETLFSLTEVFCGPQIYRPAAGRAQVLRATTKKGGRQLF